MISRSQPETAALTAAAMRSGSSGLDRQAVRLAARLAGLRGEHQRVGVDDLPGAGSARRSAAPRRPVGRIATTGRRRTSSRVAPAAAAAATSAARSRCALGQQQLAGAHVLADRAHVLVGRHGGAELRGARRR